MCTRLPPYFFPFKQTFWLGILVGISHLKFPLPKNISTCRVKKVEKNVFFFKKIFVFLIFFRILYFRPRILRFTQLAWMSLHEKLHFFPGHSKLWAEIGHNKKKIRFFSKIYCIFKFALLPNVLKCAYYCFSRTPSQSRVRKINIDPLWRYEDSQGSLTSMTQIHQKSKSGFSLRAHIFPQFAVFWRENPFFTRMLWQWWGES